MHSREVSILVLLDDSLEESSKFSLICGLLFQSLFSWMIRSKPPHFRARRKGLVVSILVLLDDSLEVDTLPKVLNTCFPERFNPCSLG